MSTTGLMCPICGQPTLETVVEVVVRGRKVATVNSVLEAEDYCYGHSDIAIAAIKDVYSCGACGYQKIVREKCFKS